MTLWRVWICSHCFGELRVNKDYTEEEYKQIHQCICGGEMHWQYNEEDGRN